MLSPAHTFTLRVRTYYYDETHYAVVERTFADGSVRDIRRWHGDTPRDVKDQMVADGWDWLLDALRDEDGEE